MRLPAFCFVFGLCLCLLASTACKPKVVLPAKNIKIPSAVVFCFHDIGYIGRYAVSEADFDAILTMLAGYRVLALEDWASGSFGDDTRPRVVLTFDDGYAAHREMVLPKLRQRGMGATFYFYSDQLARDEKWRSAMRGKDNAINFGSHSWSHALLRDLPYAQLFRELYLARTYLESVTGTKIKSFAWPYGYYEAAGVKAATDAGFTLQVSVDYRVATASDISRVIPRFTIYGRHPREQVRQILESFGQKKPKDSDR